MSKHLKVLRGGGLVTTRVDANRRIYRLRPQPLAEVDAWLQPFREQWADRLDALGQFLESDATAGTDDPDEGESR